MYIYIHTHTYICIYYSLPEDRRAVINEALCAAKLALDQVSALNPEPQTLNPEPCTLNPEPRTLYPEPWTLIPES